MLDISSKSPRNGKLIPEGKGALMVLRGIGGAAKRAVSIHGVQEGKLFRLEAQLSDGRSGNTPAPNNRRVRCV